MYFQHKLFEVNKKIMFILNFQTQCVLLSIGEKNNLSAFLVKVLFHLNFVHFKVGVPSIRRLSAETVN